MDEAKLNSVLNNPQIMRQLMAMAQSLGAQQPEAPKDAPKEAPQKRPETPQPPLDLSALQAVLTSRLTGEQRTLLSALSPYLSRTHIAHLEKAMRAAQLAQLLSGMLGQSHGGEQGV